MYKIINKRKKITVFLIDVVVSFFFKITSLLRKKNNTREEPIKNQSPRSILVVRFAYIGDVVLTLPVFPKLKERFPNSTIVFLTSTKTMPLCLHNPYIDEIITWDPPWFYGNYSLNNFKKYLSLLKSLINRRFDLAIDMRADIRNIFFILYLSRSKWRLSYSFGGGAYLLTDIVPYHGLKHKIDIHLDMVYFLGAKSSKAGLKIVLTDEEKREAKNALQSIRTKERPLVIAVHPGVRVPLKQWDQIKYTELTSHLVSSIACQVLLLGEASEKAIAQYILAKVPHTHSFVESLTLRQLAAVIEHCDLLICNDSAPMHLGVAVDTPTVTIFGPSKSFETGPYTDIHRVVENTFLCRFNCDESRCNHREYKACLRSVTVEQVLTTVEELLEYVGVIQRSSKCETVKN